MVWRMEMRVRLLEWKRVGMERRVFCLEDGYQVESVGSCKSKGCCRMVGWSDGWLMSEAC